MLKRVGASTGWRCSSCNELLSCVFELDHKVPIHKGGEDTAENLQPLCCQCHAVKTQTERLERMHERRRAIQAAREESEVKPPFTPQPQKEEKKTEAQIHNDTLENRFLKYAFVR